MSTVIESPRTADHEEFSPYPVKRWSLKEYQDLVQLGVLDDEPVELLDGWIVPKMPRNPQHDAAMMRLTKVLYAVLHPGLDVRTQSSIAVGRSQPEPDGAIVRGEADDFDDRHPGKGGILLVVEVADTSLRRDRQKAAIYAGAGIPTYWIINLSKQTVEVYENPRPRKRRYDEPKTYRRGEAIPLRLDDRESTVPVDELLRRR